MGLCYITVLILLLRGECHGKTQHVSVTVICRCVFQRYNLAGPAQANSQRRVISVDVSTTNRAKFSEEDVYRQFKNYYQDEPFIEVCRGRMVFISRFG